MLLATDFNIRGYLRYKERLYNFALCKLELFVNNWLKYRWLKFMAHHSNWQIERYTDSILFSYQLNANLKANVGLKYLLNILVIEKLTLVLREFYMESHLS